MLLFTDGVDSPGNFKTNNLSVMDVMERATRDDVMLYAIGLESRLPYGRRQSPLQGALGGGFGGQGGGGMTQRPDPGLPKIAAETGGGYFELTRADDLKSTFARVAEELHQQYALGLRADEARWQVARPRGQAEGQGDEGAGAQELCRGEAADILRSLVRDQSSRSAVRRRCLVSERCRFDSRRFNFDAPEGRVLRRFFGLIVA